MGDCNYLLNFVVPELRLTLDLFIYVTGVSGLLIGHVNILIILRSSQQSYV